MIGFNPTGMRDPILEPSEYFHKSKLNLDFTPNTSFAWTLKIGLNWAQVQIGPDLLFWSVFYFLHMLPESPQILQKACKVQGPRTEPGRGRAIKFSLRKEVAKYALCAAKLCSAQPLLYQRGYGLGLFWGEPGLCRKRWNCNMTSDLLYKVWLSPASQPWQFPVRLLILQTSLLTKED